MVGGIAEMIRAEQVFLLQECVDMRWGIDRLSGKLPDVLPAMAPPMVLLTVSAPNMPAVNAKQ